MKPALVVMAAGMGSRYGGLKQIDPVGPHGEIVLDYSVFDALRAGFGRVIFVIREQIAEAFRATVEPHFRGRVDFAYAFQELDKLPAGFRVPPGRAKPWGTGHAILMCRDLVKEPFAVINADDFYGRRSFATLAEELRRTDPATSDFSLVGFVLRNTLSDHGTVARALCERDAAGYLTRIVERLKIAKTPAGARALDEGAEQDLTADELVSMNMFGFTPALFEQLDRRFRDFLPGALDRPKAEFLIPTVVGELIAAGAARMKVLSSNEQWYGVTYTEDKPAVVAGIRGLIARGEYPERLWP